MPSFPADRNLGTEISGITNQLGGITAANYNLGAFYNPQITGNNVTNFNNALRGSFDAQAFFNAHPGAQDQWNAAQASGDLKGWTPAQFAASFIGGQENDPRLTSYYSNGIGTTLRQGYDQANPQIAQFGGTLSGTLDRLNGQGPATYGASGAGDIQQRPTALASFDPAQARAGQAQFTASRQQMANGGPLLDPLTMDAGRNLGQVSATQGMLNQRAQELARAGGNLTQAETQQAQDSARAAYADRGLLRSNRGIGAEILSTDAARRQRLMENTGLAQQIDASSQQQLAAGRNYALGVQGQGQNLSQFNTGQGNTLGTFNAGQANALSQFNAGQRQQNSQFNAGQANQIGAGLAQFNAGQTNAQNLGWAGLNQANNQFNATATNDAARFNATATNANANDQWNRSLGLGNYYLSQAQNPAAVTSSLLGTTPDYTNSLLNYGSDLNNTNYNAAAARYNSAQNRSGSLLGKPPIGAAGTALGGPLGGIVGNGIGKLFGG